MWTCPVCGQQFLKTNQSHSCMEKELADFFRNKPEHTIALYREFEKQYKKIGAVTVHPAKSMIAFAAKKRIAYVIKVGKDFVDVVFSFPQPYNDNLCFYRIAQVPGSQQFNHHFRILHKDDINEEVLHFMKLAYQAGS